MHGQDARMRQLGLQGNVCRVALRLDGGFNTALLRERVTASPMLNWLARVRITRPLPVFPAVWRTVDQPGAVLYEHDGPEVNGAGTGQLPREVMERDLHAGEGAALALDLVRQADDTRHLVLSWNHALMDVRGAELVLRHLNSNGGAKESPTMEDLINPDQMTSSWSRWWANVKIARGSMGCTPLRPRAAIKTELTWHLCRMISVNGEAPAPSSRIIFPFCSIASSRARPSPCAGLLTSSPAR